MKIPWTPAELRWIEKHRTMERAKAHAKFCKRFGSSVNFGAYCSLCKRKSWHTGRDGRLKPGNIPPNKGKKMPFNANTAKTQFKKGQNPHNTKKIGHEWLHPNGYVYIIIDEINPHTGYKHRSVLKHKHLWEKKNGPIPKGHCLKCKSGDRTNADPSNWELIPRGALPFLNGHRGFHYDQVKDEAKPTVLALAKMRYAVGVARKSKSKRPAKTPPVV